MPLSYVSYTGTSTPSAGPFDFASISFLDPATVAIKNQIAVFIDGTQLTLDTDYSVDTSSGKTITLIGAYVGGLASGEYLKIARRTKSDARYVDYNDSSNLTEQILDLDSNQEFFLIQENQDSLDDGMGKGEDGNWDAQGLKIKNMGEAVDANDAVTFAQVSAIVGGGVTGEFSDQVSTTWTGDGTTTAFTLPDRAGKEAQDQDVFLNGVKQLPVTAYTVADSGDDMIITFVAAPPNGSVVEAVYDTGVAIGTVSIDAIGTSQIQDDAVTVDKIDGGATDAQTHFLKSSSDVVSWDVLGSADLADFISTVQTVRLDQMATPTSSVSMGSQRLTSVSTPSADSDAATKEYADSLGSLWSTLTIVRSPAGSFNITFPGSSSQNWVGIIMGSATANWVGSGSFEQQAQIVFAGVRTGGTVINCRNRFSFPLLDPGQGQLDRAYISGVFWRVP
jgi:hypothetical protein